MVHIDYRALKFYHGKLFLSQDDAAAAFGCEALPLTAVDCRERAAIILPVYIRTTAPAGIKGKRMKLFTYGPVVCGGHSSVGFYVVFRYLFDLIIPRRVSFVHTHPFCTGHKPEVFSSGDELVARLPGVHYMYLASPGGCLYKYSGRNPVRNQKGELVLDAVDTGLPVIRQRWDCRHERLPRKTSVTRLIRATDRK